MKIEKVAYFYHKPNGNYNILQNNELSWKCAFHCASSISIDLSLRQKSQ